MMEASDIISIVSITFSSMISICSFLFAWKEKKHIIEHNERHTERNEIVNVFSEYMSSTSVAKLGVYLCRAASQKANESVSSFCQITDQFIDKLEYSSFKVLSVKELQSDAISKEIADLINRYQGIVYRLNDLKAICSLDKLTSTQEDDVGRMVSSIEQSIAKVKEMRNSIIEKMQNIVCEYTKRIKK